MFKENLISRGVKSTATGAALTAFYKDKFNASSSPEHEDHQIRQTIVSQWESLKKLYDEELAVYISEETLELVEAFEG